MAEKKKPAGYKKEIQSLHVVAVKKGQHNVNAPEHATWGTLKCASCPDEFLIGPPRIFGVFEETNQYVKRLREILTVDHKQGKQHRDDHDLGA
jgi:hypothetical protein